MTRNLKIALPDCGVAITSYIQATAFIDIWHVFGSVTEIIMAKQINVSVLGFVHSLHFSFTFCSSYGELD